MVGVALVAKKGADRSAEGAAVRRGKDGEALRVWAKDCPVDFTVNSTGSVNVEARSVTEGMALALARAAPKA